MVDRKNNINIWGKNGCALPSGRLCHACCEALYVPLDNNYFKPPYSPCPSQCSLAGGEGCSLQGESKPESCKSYRCEKDEPQRKLLLIGTAYYLGLVNLDEAILAISRVAPHWSRNEIVAVITRYADEFGRNREFRPIDQYLDGLL